MTRPGHQFVVVGGESLDIGSLRGSVVAIGTFDGVHRGHRAVIDAARTRARTQGRPAAVLTFEPPPRAFFMPDEELFRLTSERDKLRLLAATGIDGVIILTFDASLAAQSAEAFIQNVLVDRLAVSGVAVGFNFHFGTERRGNPDLLVREGRYLGFAVDVVPPLKDNDGRISSGRIRGALVEGDVETAARLLGFPWFVSGTVIHGGKRGRDLGFPTANIVLDPACRLRHGIYAVRVRIGEALYGGVASFGRRPMFDNGAPVLEVYVFDFSGDLYGQDLDVAFIAWIRDEARFDTLDDLIRRMNEDSHLARALIEKASDDFPPFGVVPSE